MVKIVSPITPDWQRAVARAAEDRKAGRVPERVGCRTYRVASASGKAPHTVVVNSLINLDAACDCEAGQRGLKCRHAAAALCEAARRIALCERERATAPQAPSPERRAEVSALMARFARP